jgi:hypothetical protein
LVGSSRRRVQHSQPNRSIALKGREGSIPLTRAICPIFGPFTSRLEYPPPPCVGISRHDQMFCCCPSLLQSSPRWLRPTTGRPSRWAVFQLPNSCTEHSTRDPGVNRAARTSSHTRGHRVANSDRDAGSNGYPSIDDYPGARDNSSGGFGTNGHSRDDPGGEPDCDARDDSSHFDAFSWCDSGCCCPVAQFFSIRLGIGCSPNAKQSVCQRVLAEL